MRTTQCRAFTLLEVVAMIPILILAGVLLGVGTNGARNGARGVVCQDNLRWQGNAYAQYAADERGQITSYSWREGFTYPSQWPAIGRERDEDLMAMQSQSTDLLRRHTGRGDGQNKILNDIFIAPFRRYNHLPLLDYLGINAPQMVMACPEDAELIASKLDPLDDSLWATTSEYNDFADFAEDAARMRYPFSSTYQTVPYAVFIEGRVTSSLAVTPVSYNSHLYGISNDPDHIATRNLSEVLFPALKVYIFELNDRHTNKDAPFYAYGRARCNQLFFDGSVDGIESSQSQPGWDPIDPESPDPFMYKYTPLSTEPVPIGDPERLLPVRYRYTREGLRGFDYQLRPSPDWEPRP